MGLLIGWEECEARATDVCGQCGEIVKEDTVMVKSPPPGAEGADEHLCLGCYRDLTGDAGLGVDNNDDGDDYRERGGAERGQSGEA